MSENRLWNALTGGGNKKPYGMVRTQELPDSVTYGGEAVKCDDRFYMVRNSSGVFFYDGESGRCLMPQDLPGTGEADGFETEISLAGDVIIKTSFGKGKLVLDGESFDVTVAEAGERKLSILFDSGDVILFDVSRFLLYACVGGEFICGYVEV